MDDHAERIAHAIRRYSVARDEWVKNPADARAARMYDTAYAELVSALAAALPAPPQEAPAAGQQEGAGEPNLSIFAPERVRALRAAADEALQYLCRRCCDEEATRIEVRLVDALRIPVSANDVAVPAPPAEEPPPRGSVYKLAPGELTGEPAAEEAPEGGERRRYVVVDYSERYRAGIDPRPFAVHFIDSEDGDLIAWCISREDADCIAAALNAASAPPPPAPSTCDGADCLSGEAVMLMREHLAGVGIEAAFADDAAAKAAAEIGRLRARVAELAVPPAPPEGQPAFRVEVHGGLSCIKSWTGELIQGGILSRALADDDAAQLNRVCRLWAARPAAPAPAAPTDAGDWKRAALQARDDLKGLELEWGGTLGVKLAEWSSPANTIRWIDELEAAEGSDAPAPAAPFAITAAHLERQREWSARTFGPGERTAGVVDHIRKELAEIEADPADLGEWVDVIILALDGAWRAGHQPQTILDGVLAKQERNEAREWPDWRTCDISKAIEHVRSVAPAPAAEGPKPQRPVAWKLTNPSDGTVWSPVPPEEWGVDLAGWYIEPLYAAPVSPPAAEGSVAAKLQGPRRRFRAKYWVDGHDVGWSVIEEWPTETAGEWYVHQRLLATSDDDDEAEELAKRAATILDRELVGAAPVSPRDESELRRASEAAAKELETWLAEGCECPPEGHHCGRRRVEGVRDRLRAALDAAPASEPAKSIRYSTYELAPGELTGGPPYPTPGVAPSVRELRKAGALIAAEIDRLLRLDRKAGQPAKEEA